MFCLHLCCLGFFSMQTCISRHDQNSRAGAKFREAGAFFPLGNASLQVLGKHAIFFSSVLVNLSMSTLESSYT